MPTYEFKCPEGHDFEKFFRSIGTAEPRAACPVCGETAARKISAGAGLVFKGSGFYITDYGKDGKKDQQNAPGKTGGGSEAKQGESASAGSGGEGNGGTPGGSAGAKSEPAGGSSSPGSGSGPGASPANPAPAPAAAPAAAKRPAASSGE